VKSKDEKPTWVVPDSIYAKMEDPKRVVPPAPTTRSATTASASTSTSTRSTAPTTRGRVGRLTTHGCVRLYPEDIEYLYPVVDRGYPGEFVYQP
jgi:L,D-transpeptidase ErfK/SrfK